MNAGQDLDALLGFLNHIAEAELVNRNTALGQASACRAMFEVLGYREQTDILALNLDDVFRRHESTLPRMLSDRTILTYRNRVRRAVADFRRFRTDPANWRPARPYT